MDKTAWVNRAKRVLGYPVVQISTPDESIEGFVGIAVETVQPYIRDVEVIEGQAPVLDLSDVGVVSIRRVLASRTNLSSPTVGGEIDPFFTVNLWPGTGIQRRLVSIATINLYRTEMEAVIPKDWQFHDGKLYLSGYVGPVTVEAITERVLQELPDVYQKWVLDYTVAQLKVTEGEIRSKLRVPNAPIETNGSELKAEGLKEKEALEHRLGRELGAIYAIR